MSALPSQPTLKTSFRVGVSDLINGHNLPFNSSSDYNAIGSMVCLYSKELLLHRVSNWASLWPRPTFSRDGSNVVHISNAVDLSGQPCTTSFLQLLQGNDPNLLPNGKLPNAAKSP